VSLSLPQDGLGGGRSERLDFGVGGSGLGFGVEGLGFGA